MSPTTIHFAESALSDLEGIWEWYELQGVPEVGHRLVEELLERIELLAHHPEMGRVVPEFDLSFLREIIHSPFRVVYRRDDSQVRIVRVWRSERLMRLPREEDKCEA